MIYQDTRTNAEKGDLQAGLGERDLEQIVVSSGLRFRPRPPKIPTPFEVVRYSGTLYKVRAYLSSEAAREYLELIGETEHLFARCYGQVDQFLVLEYVDCTPAAAALTPGNLQPVLDAIPAFLADLATVPTRRSPREDFDFLCRSIEAAGIFRPRTIELIRRYFSQVETSGMNWGLEYYDAMPRNFAYTEEGRLVSIDEKHLRLGPRGVSLIKPMEQLPPEDFLRLKEAYLAKVGSVPLDDPKYHRFLRFYRHMTALGVLDANRTRAANMYENSFHTNRQAVLRMIDAPGTVRRREETRWAQYQIHQVRRRFQKAPGFLKRRLIRRGTLSTAG